MLVAVTKSKPVIESVTITLSPAAAVAVQFLIGKTTGWRDELSDLFYDLADGLGVGTSSINEGDLCHDVSGLVDSTRLLEAARALLKREASE